MPINTSGGGTVRNLRVFDIGSGRCAASESRWAQIECGSDLREVPVHLETRLLMELRTQERSVDLREISQLVLGDLGAALQIFRRAAQEYWFPEDRPTRIEDCISSLGLQSCLEALSSERSTSGTCSNDVIETWRHAKEVAECCKQLASEPAATVNPDEAYLVGLFHQIYSLPGILGWGASDSTSKAAALCGHRMAEDWSLPRCVLDYFSELQDPAHEQQWSRIVQRAHEMASSPLPNNTLIEI